MSGCDAYPEDKHVCMLPQEPKYFDLPPTAGHHRYFLYKIRELTLPSDWHYGSLLFIRSQRRLKRERDRQVELGHWLIWHPYSAIKYYWDFIMLLFTYATLLYLPMQVFFACPNPYDPFILFGDVLAFIHILTRFITGQDQEDGSNIILQPKEIARRYLYGVFICDLISALPLQCIEIFHDCRHPTHTVWFVFKILRMVSLRKQWRNIYKQLGLSYIAATVFTVSSRTILFYHWMTYIHFQVPTFYYHYFHTTDEWLSRLRVRIEPGDTIFKKYTANLYYVCGLCNGAGIYSPIVKPLLQELIMNSVLGILGLLFLTYTFTTLLRLAIYARFEVFLYNGRLKELSEYMLFKGLPKGLQQKIQLFLNYKFYEHYFNEQAIMNTINEQIKQDINMHCCKKLVMCVPLFQDMPVALINNIVFSLVRVLYMPGEVAHLRDGAFFGESALLNPGAMRSATVIALEITEMYKLDATQFTTCLQPYPHLKRRLDDASARHAVRRRSTKYR